MCGICGFVSRRETTVFDLKRMNDSIKYRGPDDSGELVFKNKSDMYVGIGHRRLSIMDLSENGHQNISPSPNYISV